MKIEKYFGIDCDTSQQMIEATKNMINEKRGDNGFQNTKTFLFDEYAVLQTQNMNFRNVDTQDHDLKHLERLAVTLLDLKAQGVNVVPILAFQSDDGNGYIIQPRARGAELYDRDKIEASDKEYVLERVKFISNAPQEHFDKFTEDALKIIDAGVIIDSAGKDNFFYDEAVGFQFIDLNAHFDYEYGLTDEKPQAKKLAFIKCFLPLSHCPYPFVIMPKYGEMVSKLLFQLTDGEHASLKEHNKKIFEKCRTAAINNGISEEIIREISTSNEFIYKFILQMQHLNLI
jgi:hypothetical protein